MPRFGRLRAYRLATRRAFIGTIAGGVRALPLAAAAQQAGKSVPHWLLSAPPASPFEKERSR